MKTEQIQEVEPEPMDENLRIRLPAGMKDRLSRAARKRLLRPSDLARQAIARAMEEEEMEEAAK